MYKLKKEYIGQNVTVYTPDRQVIKLEGATQDEFKLAYKINGNERFIDLDKKEEVKKEKKPVEKKEEVKKNS